MTDYEIFGYVTARMQPTFDAEPVQDATIEDLDRVKLVRGSSGILAREIQIQKEKCPTRRSA